MADHGKPEGPKPAAKKSSFLNNEVVQEIKAVLPMLALAAVVGLLVAFTLSPVGLVTLLPAGWLTGVTAASLSAAGKWGAIYTLGTIVAYSLWQEEQRLVHKH